MTGAPEGNDADGDPRSVPDRQLLLDLGFGALEPATFAGLEEVVSDEIEDRVGRRLTATMSRVDLDRFETFLDRGDEESALEVLLELQPDLDEIVRTELAVLARELEDAAPIVIAMLTIATTHDAPTDSAIYSDPPSGGSRDR